MDLPLVMKGSSFSGRRRRWLLLLVACGLSGYGVYRVYHSPSVARRRRMLMNLFGAMASMAELVSDSAEVIGVVCRDLKGFLLSDSNEIPNSLKQIFKIGRTEDFSQSLAVVSEAITLGILRGYGSNLGNSVDSRSCSSSSSFTDRVIDRVFSKAGTGFVSVVVGSFARNLVLGFRSNDAELDVGKGSLDVPRWVNALCDNRCRELIADCMEKFVGTAISVYLDKTMDINIYDDVFAGLTNPKHRDEMRDILVSVCNGAVETLVKTTHQVLTSAETKPGQNSRSVHEVTEQDDAAGGVEHHHSEKTDVSRRLTNERSNGRSDNASWCSVISSTMAVPNNRKFVFDVTGRVTLGTLRSITEILLSKLSEGFRESSHVVHEEVVEKGRRVIRYVGVKSSVIATIFVAFYLHVFSSNRVLLVS